MHPLRTPLMNRLRLLLPAALVALCASPAYAVRYTVEFGGSLTSSFNLSTGASQFADFAAGSPFHGSFVFDSTLITGFDSLAGTGGAFRRYFSAIRDYRVEFQLPTRTYVYEPPLFGAGRFTGQSLTLWNVANDYTGQPDLSGHTDILAMRLENYPARWLGGPAGQTVGEVPPSQYVNGWYPHAAFFELSDYEPPLDATASTSSLVDVAQFFARSGARQYSLRFTDVNAPSWGTGTESINAVMYCDITQLAVIVPEPAGVVAALSALGGLLAAAPRLASHGTRASELRRALIVGSFARSDRSFAAERAATTSLTGATRCSV